MCLQGITDTALTIYDTATREHEQRGMTGAVGGVLRQLPPAVVKPLIVATEATSNVLGGMRNQIHPDARQEESQKWRLGEEWALLTEIYSAGLHYINIDIHTGLSAQICVLDFMYWCVNACKDHMRPVFLFCCLCFSLKRSWCLSDRQLEAVIAQI